MLWDSLHNCSAAMGAYQLFRRDRPGWRGGGVSLYARAQQGCVELCLGMSDEPAETLWVRSSMQTDVSNVVVSVCYRQPDQGNNWKKQLEGQHSVAQAIQENLITTS